MITDVRNCKTYELWSKRVNYIRVAKEIVETEETFSWDMSCKFHTVTVQ